MKTSSIFNPFMEVFATKDPSQERLLSRSDSPDSFHSSQINTDTIKNVAIAEADADADADAIAEEEKSPFSFLTSAVKVKVKAPAAVLMDQPRGKGGERLLYTYPNLPLIRVGTAEYSLLVGSSDKSATAWLMQFDGAANPNPGPASSGAVLWSPKDANGYRAPVYEMGKFLGKATNNLAEIQGLLLGLKIAAMRGARDLLIEGDSELIIRQQTREYKVSNKNLKAWWAEIQAAMMDEIPFDWIAIRHVRREFNERADSITKEVLSKREGFTRC
jgi:ribonuclease HI